MTKLSVIGRILRNCKFILFTYQIKKFILPAQLRPACARAMAKESARFLVTCLLQGNETVNHKKILTKDLILLQ